MSLDGFSMHSLTQELSRALVGARVDRINQPNKQTIVLSLRQPGQNFLLNICVNPQNPCAYIVETAHENPPEPPVFCMVLRKQLEAGRLTDIRQHGLDRLILLDIDTVAAGGRIVTKTLALELMGKYSNIILTQDGVIIDALRRIGQNRSRVRTVLPGDAYELPPAQDKLDLLTTDAEKIAESVRARENLPLTKAILATCLGFGPVSAKEAAFLAGLPAEIAVDKLDETDCKSLAAALTELKSAAENVSPCLVTDANRKVLAMAAFPLHYLSGEARTFATLGELLTEADRLLGSYVLPDKERWQKLVKNELNRAKHKLEKIGQEIDEAENAEIHKIRGDNLMTYQYELTDHASSATVADIYSENGEKMTIPLDPKLTIIQNMQACYKKYDKLKRAQTLLLEQKRKNEDEINYLSGLTLSLKTSTTLGEIAEIRRELVAGGYLREKAAKKPNDKPSHPFCFHAADGAEILVGKNNYQNDRLTFKTAQPTDIWLHTKDIPGSHVILRTGGQEPSNENLRLAAEIAAHFSQAQDGSNVPVDYVACSRVRKPSGAKPGFVIFTGQKTLYVTPDEKKLGAILGSELKSL